MNLKYEKIKLKIWLKGYNYMAKSISEQGNRLEQIKRKAYDILRDADPKNVSLVNAMHDFLDIVDSVPNHKKYKPGDAYILHKQK